MQVVSVLGRRPCGNGFSTHLDSGEWFSDATHRPARAIIGWGSRGRRDGPHAVWAESACTVDHGGQPDPGAHVLVTSIIESAGAMGFAAWVVWELWRAGSRVRSRPTASRRRPADCWSSPRRRPRRSTCSLLGVGSAATFFSLGAWLVAGAGATTSLAIHSIHVDDRARPLRLELGSRRIRRQPVACRTVHTRACPAKSTARWDV